MNCDFCRREVTDIAQENGLTYIVSIDRLLMPGRGRKVDSWHVCGDCINGVSELEPELTDLPIDAYLNQPTNEYWEYHECSFCDEPLDQERSYFGYCSESILPEEEDMVDKDYLLCLNCTEIIKQFLSNVPESQPEDEIYVGIPDDEINVSTDDADFGEIKDRYLDCEVGDYITFECHHDTSKYYPDTYTSGEGEIIAIDREGGGRMTIEPSEEAQCDWYYIDPRLSMEGDLEVRVQNGNELDLQGAVTVFEKISG